MQKFRHITTYYTVCWPGHVHTPSCQWGAKFPVEATEAIGTGLALQLLNHPKRQQEYYSILHVPSGRLLTRATTPTLVEAALWLRLLKDVTDWTQSGEILQANAELQTVVHAAREQAIRLYVKMLGDRHEGRWEYSDTHTGESILKV